MGTWKAQEKFAQTLKSSLYSWFLDLLKPTPEEFSNKNTKKLIVYQCPEDIFIILEHPKKMLEWISYNFEWIIEENESRTLTNKTSSNDMSWSKAYKYLARLLIMMWDRPNKKGEIEFIPMHWLKFDLVVAEHLSIYKNMKVWEHLRGVSYTPKNKKVSSIIPLGWTPLTSQQESLLTKEERAQYKKIKQVYEL